MSCTAGSQQPSLIQQREHRSTLVKGALFLAAWEVRRDNSSQKKEPQFPPVVMFAFTLLGNTNYDVLWFTFIQNQITTCSSRGCTVGRCTTFSLQKGKTGPELFHQSTALHCLLFLFVNVK